MSEIPYSRITIKGPDAFEFLQAQLTADLAALTRQSETEQLRSAWCNPKGRVICIPTVMKIDNGYDLSLPSDLADPVVQRLTMFRFRAKVEFTVHAGRKAGSESALQMLQAGVPEITLAQTEKFTPHMLNLDLLQIVSLDKGCYPGQEIVARTHYRGASKRRLQRFTSSASVAPGDKVSTAERDIGEVVNAVGNELLAVVPVASASEQLNVNGAPLTHIELPYQV